MNSEINYSIIIPHKNIPELLQRCLSSIPRRSDIQIIIVDDNSDPSKVDFEKFPGQNDPCIEVIYTKEGKGAGYARNIGITKAAGKWLLFADADDFYNYCINDIFDEYVNSNADIIYFRHNSLDSDTYEITYRCPYINVYIDYWLDQSKRIDDLLRYKNTIPWAKIIKKNIVEKYDIIFDETSISNDVTFSYLVGFYAKNICADKRALYCNTVRQGSIQYTNQNIENKLDVIFVYGKRYRFFKKNDITITPRNILFANILTKFLLTDKEHFYKARDILQKLGFSSVDIMRLCFYAFVVSIPLRIIGKLFTTTFYLKY